MKSQSFVKRWNVCKACANEIFSAANNGAVSAARLHAGGDHDLQSVEQSQRRAGPERGQRQKTAAA